MASTLPDSEIILIAPKITCFQLDSSARNEEDFWYLDLLRSARDSRESGRVVPAWFKRWFSKVKTEARDRDPNVLQLPEPTREF